MIKVNLQLFGGRGRSASETPKEVGDYDKATDYFESEVQRWQKSLTAAEFDAVTQYTAGEEGTFEEVNNYLWSDQGTSYEKDVKLLDKAISKFNLKEDIVVYRGTEGADFDLSKGSVISLKGFTSTSTYFDVAEAYTTSLESSWMEKPTILKISVPKGKGRAAFVAGTAMAPEESEVLLKRNSKLKITGKTKINGRTVVTGTII